MGKRFAQLGVRDAIWLSQQPHHVQTLWFECVAVDQFGDSFKPIRSQLQKKSFQRAKKILVEAGYLEFDCKMSPDDRRKIDTWLVRNLHGIYADRYNGNPKTSYEEFLQSDYWQQVRYWILERDGHTCQSCGAMIRLEVHHLTYEHHGEEHLHPEDLVTLCRDCHAREHDK